MTALALVLALLLPSCSGDKSADASGLLSTIPSDASMVVVVNTRSLLEKAGCKVSDDKVTPGKEAQGLLDKVNDQSARSRIDAFCKGETGIDPSVVALFQVGYYTYATGYLADPEKFKSWVAKNQNSAFTSEDGIDVCAGAAVSNSRFWINLEQNSIDPKEIKHFAALDDSQSFMSNAYAEKLSSVSKDMEGWGNINGLLNTANLPFQTRATVQVAVQTLFADPASLWFSINFGKGEARLEAGVLNGKGKTAKYQLPSEELDIKTIESIGGTARSLAAVAIPGKLVEKLIKETASQGPSVFGLYLQQLQGLDGTIALAYDDAKTALRGIVTTNGKDITGLTDILGQNEINVKKEGDMLILSKGSVSGPTEVAELGKEFKGAILGVSTTGFGNFSKDFERMVMTLTTDGDGLRLNVIGRSADKNENLLLTLLRNL